MSIESDLDKVPTATDSNPFGIGGTMYRDNGLSEACSSLVGASRILFDAASDLFGRFIPRSDDTVE